MDTSVGKQVKRILADGDLIPDFMVIGLWMKELCNNLKDDQGVLFDGALRRVAEAEQADRFMDFLERKDTLIPILLNIFKSILFLEKTNRFIGTFFRYSNVSIVPNVSTFGSELPVISTAMSMSLLSLSEPFLNEPNRIIAFADGYFSLIKSTAPDSYILCNDLGAFRVI